MKKDIAIAPNKTKTQMGAKNLAILRTDPLEVFTKEHGVLYPDSVCWTMPKFCSQKEFGEWIIEFK